MNGDSNKIVIKMIVGTLCALALWLATQIYILISYGKTVPTELWLLTGNVITALTAMLVKTSPTQSTPEPTAKPAGELKVPAQELEVTR